MILQHYRGMFDGGATARRYPKQITQESHWKYTISNRQKIGNSSKTGYPGCTDNPHRHNPIKKKPDPVHRLASLFKADPRVSPIKSYRWAQMILQNYHRWKWAIDFLRINIVLLPMTANFVKSFKPEIEIYKIYKCKNLMRLAHMATQNTSKVAPRSFLGGKLQCILFH